MLMKFSWFVFLIILVVCRATPLYDRYNDEDDNDDHQANNQRNSITSEQLAEYLSRKLQEESSSSSEVLGRNTRYSNQNDLSKRDALWTTAEVLDCVRRLKYYKNGSKLDRVTEMLNCYRRLKHSG